MSFDGSDIDDKELRRLLVFAPGEFATTFRKAAASTIGRYRGFHRKRRMSRKSSTDRRGIYSSRKKGFKNNRFFPVKLLGRSGTTGLDALFDGAGAEIVVVNAILNQLERGAIVQGRSMLVPFSTKQTRGQASARSKRLLKSGKLFRFKPKNQPRAFLVEARGRKKNRFDFHYTMVDRIVIPPRLEFEKLFDQYKPETLKEIRRVYGVLVRRLNAGQIGRLL